MPFPVTYLLDQLLPSETFIRREVELLCRRGWPVFRRLLKGYTETLAFTLTNCPEGLRPRFLQIAYDRIVEEWPQSQSPATAARILKRIPQVDHLIRLTAESDSRLIHAHFAGITADVAAITAQTLGLPWTCSVHAHDVFACSPELLYRRLHSAAGIAACTRLAADAVIAAGIPKAKVTVIRHGLPLNEYLFDPVRPIDIIFSACRLEPKKGLDTLVRACAQLVKRGVRFTCVIAGAGSCLAALKQLCVELNVEHNVTFIGWQPEEETRENLIKASVLALPSRLLPDGDRDGIPNILVEAMALGTPVVTTTANAASEVIGTTVNGLLVPPDDPFKLTDALAMALTAKDQMVRIAKAGRATVEEHFDGVKNIEQLEEFFKRATKTGPQ